MRFIKLSALFLGLSLPLAAAGTFQLGAQVSKDHVELGESFVLALTLSVDGNFTFQPQIEIPKFDGFQVQAGPQQSQQVNWVNGVVKQQMTVQWELVALKSGTLTLGPFRASANDASLGVVAQTAPAITITVAKGQGNVLPPTPTPEPDGALNPQAQADQLRGIKPDLGPPWARIGIVAAAFLAALGLVIWLATRPPKPKKIEVVRDPGQVALAELEKARQLLLAGDEPGYYKELGRIIRFYLRHRMRMPEKELTLFEAEGLLQKALLKAGPDKAEEGAAAIERLQEILFAKSAPQAKDNETLAPALRSSILNLEKGATWNEEDLVKAELDRAAETLGSGETEAYFQAMLKIFKAYMGRQEERLGKDLLEERLAQGLDALGPAATARVGYVLLSKRLRDDLDLEKLNNDLQRLAEHLEKGVIHGKRK
jgi:hypothetical protein